MWRTVREASSLTANHCHSPGRRSRIGWVKKEKRNVLQTLKGDSNYLFTRSEERRAASRRHVWIFVSLPNLLGPFAIPPSRRFVNEERHVSHFDYSYYQSYVKGPLKVLLQLTKACILQSTNGLNDLMYNYRSLILLICVT